MNKLYTLLFLLLNFVVINTTQAQLALTYGGSVADTLPTLAQQEEFGAELEIEFPQGVMNISNPLMNTSDQQVMVQWERTGVDLPEGWLTSVCFGEICYADFISSSEQTGPVTIGPNTSADFKLQVITNANGTDTGEGTTEVKFWVGTDTVVATIMAVVAEVEIPVDTTVVASIQDFLDAEKSFSVYPNPVRNFLNIELNNYEEIQVIEIYNMLGKVVERLILEDAKKIQKIDLSSLTEGMFFISLLDNNNNLIETKRFSKVR